MERSDCMPNAYTYASIFTACADLKDISQANTLFSKFSNKFSVMAVDTRTAVDAAILMFIKCRSIGSARNVSFCS